MGMAVAAAVVVALAVTAVAWWPRQPAQTPLPAPASQQQRTAPTEGTVSGGPIVLEDVPVQPRPEGFPVGEPTADEPTAAGEPVAEDAHGIGAPALPADPCANAGGRLVVSPDPLHLTAGKNAGSLTVRNCGTEPTDWTSLSKPWVKLAAQQGTLAAGATHELGFTVDDSALPAGDYTFRIKVSQPGHNVYVDVYGSKVTKDVAQQPGTAGDDDDKPAGCAASCITMAWLTPSHGTPDLALEVRTHTAAKLFVKVGTEAPQLDERGHPYIAQPAVSDSTDLQFRTLWKTTLTPLEPGTKYHILVIAVDKQGQRTSETGQFTTTKPITGLSAGEDGGCGSNCVESALLAAKPGSPNMTLTVRTHVPAKLAVYLDDQDPQTNGAGEPYFPGAPDPAAATDEPRTEWTTELELEYGTTYRIILEAVDERSRSQFKQGSFSTGPAPAMHHSNDVLVTFHKIHVSNDADGGIGRGELQFMFEANGEQRNELAVGERKVQAPDWIDLDRGDRGQGRSVAVYGAPDLLPIRVQAWERDLHNDDFGFEFCQRGDRMFDEVSGRVEFDDCDIDIEWNTAAATIDLHADTGGGALPACYGLEGITGDICTVLVADGDDPHFTVYVTIDFIE